jgi:hypothetical protein
LPDGLKTPSGNIVCILDDTGEPPAALRCDISNLRPSRLPAPKECPLAWGDAFEISETGKSGELACHGDTIMHEEVTTLSYGAVWQRGVFTCRSQPAALTCSNARGHGFSLSSASQRLF